MKRLLIIETINDLNEGKALKEALELMKKTWNGKTTKYLNIDLKEAYEKSTFLNYLKEETDYLHISAHGQWNKRKRKHVLKIGENIEITPDDIRKHKPKASNIFVNACRAGHFNLAKAFFDFDPKKKGFYVGPVGEPYYDGAFLVALQFHRGAFVEEFSQGINKGKERVSKKAIRYVEELKSIPAEYKYFDFPKDLKN